MGLAKPRYPLHLETLTDVERGWVAGLFEGEGCIHLTKRGIKSPPCPQISIYSTDRDIISTLHKRVGGRFDGKPQKMGGKNKQPIYRWIACGWLNAVSFKKWIVPLLGKRRKAKFKEVLSWISL